MNNILKRVPVHTAKALIDLVSVKSGDTVYLVTIEHSYQASRAWQETPTERTLWRFWGCNQSNQSIHQSSENVVDIPAATALGAAFAKNWFWALLENNQQHAAFMSVWRTTGPEATQIPETNSIALPIDLSPPQAQQVRIDIKEEWSTAKLPPAKWLFNPSIALLSDDTAAAAMNTADAHAVVWKLKNVEAPKEPLAFLPNALEPAPAAVGSKLLLFHRTPKPNWSVYFHASRYSGAYGPLPLPLSLVELDQQGQVLRTLDLSKERGMPDVFSFSVSTDQRRLALATITGSKEMPILRLYFSEDLGQTFREVGSAPLPMIPSRLSMGLGEATALVGIAYKESAAFQIEGFCVPYDK